MSKGLLTLISYPDCYAATQLPQSSKYSKSTDLRRKSLLSHIWRVPSSKALSCKHEQLFDLLTLVSLLYQNCFPNSIFFHCKKKPPKNGSFRSSGGLIIFYKGGRQPDGPEPLPRFPDVCPDIPVYIAYNVQRRDSLSEDRWYSGYLPQG